MEFEHRLLHNSGDCKLRDAAGYGRLRDAGISALESEVSRLLGQPDVTAV
jgi:hypothetical protein